MQAKKEQNQSTSVFMKEAINRKERRAQEAEERRERKRTKSQITDPDNCSHQYWNNGDGDCIKCGVSAYEIG